MQEENCSKDKVVVTICSTGKGTAEKLRSLVVDILVDASLNHIKVIPIGLANMDENLAQISLKHRIVAVVGIKNPHIDAPFIPIEQLISGQGGIVLREIVSGRDVPVRTAEPNIVLRRFCEDGLSEMLLYLNPDKVVGILLNYIDTLEKDLNLHWDNPQKLKLVVHIGCALERMVTKSGLQYDAETMGQVDKKRFAVVKKAAQIFSDTLRLSLTDDELCYIVSML